RLIPQYRCLSAQRSRRLTRLRADGADVSAGPAVGSCAVCLNCRPLVRRLRLSRSPQRPRNWLEPAFADPLRHALVFGLGFLCLTARSLHNVRPTLGGGVVLAADRVAVYVGGCAHG